MSVKKITFPIDSYVMISVMAHNDLKKKMLFLLLNKCLENIKHKNTHTYVNIPKQAIIYPLPTFPLKTLSLSVIILIIILFVVYKK